MYWTFNELNGTQVRDDSGVDNHGVFDDNLTFSPNLFEYSTVGRRAPPYNLKGIKRLHSKITEANLI